MLLALFALFSAVAAGAAPSGKACEPGQWPCSDGRCIPIAWRCDGVTHCHDAGDEFGCGWNSTCGRAQFRCAVSGLCIASAWRCDGELDCGPNDSSDEEPNLCEKDFKCPGNEARCASAVGGAWQCVPVENYCDGRRHCKDGSDEWDICDNFTKSQCAPLNCSVGCRPTQNGLSCYCNKGYEPVNGTCVDTDECQSYLSCSQSCENTAGSFRCGCASGFILQADGNSCDTYTGPGEDPPSLVIVTTNSIIRTYMNETEAPAHRHLKALDVKAIDINYANGTICYIHRNVTRSAFVCMDDKDFSKKTILPTPKLLPDYDSITYLRYDWVSRNWYLFDSGRSALFLCTYYMEYCRIIMEIQDLRGLAVNPLEGVLYYSVWGATPPGIYSASLSGQGPESLTSRKLVYPSALVFDPPSRALYWTDSYLGVVDTLAGGKRYTVAEYVSQGVHQLGVLGEWVYLPVWRGGVAIRPRRPPPSPPAAPAAPSPAVGPKAPAATAVLVMASQLQPAVPHPCATKNGGCAHICVPFWINGTGHAQCLCEHGYRLAGRTQCQRVEANAFILVARGSPPMIQALVLNNKDKSLEAFRPAAAARPAAADTYNGKIYYCDVYRYEIVTVDIESGARTLFHAGNNVDTCQDVAVDWIGRNLYWTDDALGQICVSSLKKPNTTKILVKEADFKPRSILLDPPEGMMYWSVWASGGTGAVESAFMDGSNRTTLYRGGEWPSGIALQKETKILYWVDARADVLHRMDLITKKVSVVDIVSPHKPYGLVVYEDAIYWSEHATGIVWKLQNNNITKAWQLRPPLYHMRLVDNIGRIEDSRCSSSNCSALCLLRGDVATCACAGGSCAVPHKPPPRCQDGHFRCTAGECIETVYVCDGDADCADGSDEDASPTGPCANMTCTEEGALQCDTSRCIPKQWICDGLKDCLDGADEAPATCIGRNATQPFDTAAECSNMFACASGACVPWEFYCDGHADCAGADDEQHCYSKNQTSYLSSKTQALLNPCEDHEFQCDNKYECIRKEFRCDGTSDCEDGSDETGCPARAPRPSSPAPPPPCDSPAIRCDNNTRCVPVEDQCDGNRDCVDGGDEDTCDQTVCVATRCSHTCLVTASGALCSCPAGHWLASDNATCRRAVRCDQIGKPYRNRYKCSCYEGYKLAEDGYTCKATDGAGALLVLACRHSLRAVPLGSPGAARALLSSPRNAVGVAWRADSQSPPATKLYWTDTAADKIYSAHLAHSTLSNIEVVISEGVSTAEGLAVDWLSGNLYWVDSSLHQIEVASHDGKYRRTLISSDMDNPRAIAVDPTAGLLFWSDWSGSASRIERCTLAGENRTRIATPLGGQGWPNGVALDIPEQRLYWCDAKEDAIYSATYDGKDVQVVVQGHSALDHPFALRVFGSQVYWTDWRAVAVLHANKRGASSAQTLIHTTQQPADLTIIHPALQPSGPNPCAVNNGGCSQLCLLSPHARRRCACAHSARLHEDGTTCVPHTTQLVIGRRTELRALGLDPPAGQLSASVWGASPAEIYSLEDRWFWLDTQANEIRYVKAGSSAPQTAVESGPTIQSFAVVPSEKLLIYARDDGVMAAGWEGQRITCIVYNMNVTALTYSAKRFEMFFASPLPKWHINSSRLDGSERNTWVSSPDVHTPMSLTVDDDRMRVYWIDMGSSSIAYIDLNTKKITTIPLEAGAHPVAMDVYGGRVIFADTDGVISNCTDGGQCQQIVDNYDGVVSLRVHGRGATPARAPPPCSAHCEHHCLPLSAHEHKCVCALTYTANAAECGPRDEMILLSVGWEMRSVFPVRVPGALKRPSLSIPGAADAMAYTAAGAWLYWTDSDAGAMWRVRRDNTDRQQLLQQHDVNEDWLAGIAVDWLGGHVYWADTQRLLVETAKTDGSKRFVLLDTAPHAVTGLAIDPFRGWLFLSGRLLQRVRLDGSGLETLRENPVIDVEVDMARELVYFIESDKICRMRYDGTQLDIMREAAHGEHYVAVLPYGDKIFWLDTMYLNGSVMLAPLTNLSDNYVLGSNLGDNLKDILVWSARMQNRRPASITVRNPCEVIIPVKRTTNIYNETLQMPMPHPTEEIPNFGPPCEGLCTWNGKEKVCKCPHGTLANDSVSCVPFDTFLMYSKVTKIESIHLEDADNLNPPYPPIEDKDLMRNAIALAYEFATRTLFYSDIQRGSINVVHFNGTGHQVFLTKTGAVEGMVFSASDRVLYWTSASDATVRSLRLDAAEPGAGRAACDERSCERADRVHTIYRLPAGARPRAIDLDPCEMRLYWTNWNETRPSIQRGYSSGLRLQSIITTSILMPNGLALDHGPRQLYWSDARLDKLERANYDGTARLIVSQTNTQHPFSLTVAGGWLVWGDWVARGVFRTHKLAGGGGLMRRVLKPMAVVAISPRQPVCSTDPCAYLNGGCPEICISTPTPSGLVAKCACAAGRELARDGRACVDKEPCAPAQWRCAEGGCIPEELVCDGVSHCGDVEGSDENLYYCTSRECPSDQLSCGVGGRCVAKSAACDARADCDDASDERACPLPPGHYRCDDGMSVPVAARCDGASDCDDGSDERHCANTLATLDPVTSTTAEPTDFPLPTLPPLGCSVDEFACLSHDECIPLSWQCNRQRDCQDGSDEHEHCPHHNEPVCGAGQQFCASRGACISSDADCPAAGTGTNVTGPFSVPAENCTDPQYICDGDIDCPDGADEVGCPDGVSPTSSGVSGVTAHPGELCGVSAGAVECSGKCIPPELVCDGADHCLDGLGMGLGSDEDPRLCASWERMFGALGDQGATSLAACGRGNWRCQNAACVPWDTLCDGHDDCGDYSDERRCNVNECTNFNGGCAQLCVDLPVGWTCGCLPGTRRERAGNCNPIDMCAEKPCHHICTKRGNSFRCSCHAGYRLLDDFSSCVPISNERPSILFTNRYYIRRTWLSIDGSAESTSLLIHNLTNGVALDVDLKNDCIYWSDVTRLGSSIKRTCNVSKEPTSHELLQGAALQSPDGVGVDWVGGNLYWMDGALFVARLTGARRRVLLRAPLQAPRALQLLPMRGVLYWTDWGASPHIGRCGMDGSSPTLLVTRGLGWPNALTIDYPANAIYFADAREDYIARIDLEGKGLKVLFSRENQPWLRLHHVFALGAWGGRLYWSDWETKAIESCRILPLNSYREKNNPNPPEEKYDPKPSTEPYGGAFVCRTVVSTIHRPMDLRIAHSSRQPEMPELSAACAALNCEGLCVLSPAADGSVSARCVCPEQWALVDSRRCEPRCSPAQRACLHSMQCIPAWWRCDTQDDCGDGSDEPPDCRAFHCRPGQFQCDTATCLHPARLCDAVPHCLDASDEGAHCDHFTCLSSQWKCPGNATLGTHARCIPLSSRCDSRADCPDAADERDCAPPTCPTHNFMCRGGGCVPDVWVCDEDNDCPDGSDEGTLCLARTCPPGHFRCGSGRCIPTEWLCDTEPDCPGHEDEDKCDADRRPCDPTYFKCPDGRCIPGRWKCDYEDDCGDGADEAGCVARNCSESEQRCADGACALKCAAAAACPPRTIRCVHTALCIPSAWWCDGDVDCGDGSDEAECPGVPPCDVPDHWRCDGKRDCLDGSDEDPATCAHRPCTGTMFRCPDAKCIPDNLLCDGVNDCSDKSDESYLLCEASLRQVRLEAECRQPLVLCDDFSCVPDAMICDREPKCDWRDCSQICLPRYHHNVTCKCIAGYKQFQLPDGSHACEPIGDRPILVTVSSSNTILFSELVKHDHDEEDDFTNSSEQITSVTTAYIEGSWWLYWGTNTGYVYRLDVTRPAMDRVLGPVSKDRKELLIIENGTILGVSIASELLFYSTWNRTRGSVRVSSVDGLKRYTLFSEARSLPLDIAASSDTSEVFWSEAGTRPGIRTIHFSGANPRWLVRTRIRRPRALTLFYPARRLYFVDSYSDELLTVAVDGTDLQTMGVFKHKMSLVNVTTNYKAPDPPLPPDTPPTIPFRTCLSLTPWGEWLLCGSRGVSRLPRRPPRAPRAPAPAPQPRGRIHAIAVLQRAANVNAEEHPCAENPCDASALCLPDRQLMEHKCVCPDHMKHNVTVNKVLKCSISPHNTTCGLSCGAGACVLDSSGAATCRCSSLFAGEHCQHYRCAGYCKHGVCAATNETGDDGLAKLTCVCHPRYTGSRCESLIHDPCAGYCLNQGTCHVSVDGSARCTCAPQWAGPRCHVAADSLDQSPGAGVPCGPLRCQHGGRCIAVTGPAGGPAAACECAGAWGGAACSVYVGFDHACAAKGCAPPSVCVWRSEDAFIQNPSYCACLDGASCVPPTDVTGTRGEQSGAGSGAGGVVAVIAVVIMLLLATTAGVVYWIKRRRHGAWVHARLADNVEINNPVYQPNEDDEQVHTNNGGNHFANPVYESMYTPQHPTEEQATLLEGAEGGEGSPPPPERAALL